MAAASTWLLCVAGVGEGKHRERIVFSAMAGERRVCKVSMSRRGRVSVLLGGMCVLVVCQRPVSKGAPGSVLNSDGLPRYVLSVDSGWS